MTASNIATLTAEQKALIACREKFIGDYIENVLMPVRARAEEQASKLWEDEFEDRYLAVITTDKDVRSKLGYFH